ncbi:flagellar biosynthesis protein FlhF [Thiomicrospira microaerophila]|uniref:flagellar biosynthesis protein FlhF n=1 Tax=Thiomicrospira microaerophila TaxID=406020 RepID=UPI00200C2460|nr:flagellar biosynthesis protein FlhF [Thiomicrospira microaerophila]UQB41673.1 flagellar biosynthesis protein FlhF [Thiomicrospira microaerophila]
MKIKRYVAPTMRQAMALVRAEQGPDAIIMSSRSSAEGVEVVVSIDLSQQTATEHQVKPPFKDPVHTQNVNGYHAELDRMSNEIQAVKRLLEQQLSGLAWGQNELAEPTKVELMKRLMKLGLSWEISQTLVKNVGQQQEPDQAWSFILQEIETMIPKVDRDIIESGGIVALVGPTGVGKTTTIAKIASRFVMRYGAAELALITTDCYKIGAQEQLRTFADLIGVPVYVANTQAELFALLDALNMKRLVLIDTAGMSQRDLQLSQQLTSGHAGADKVRNYLVLSAATQLNVMRDIVNSFGRVVLKGCILTKLDEALQLGNVVSVLVEAELPMAYVSVGQRVPEDLQKMTAVDLVDRVVMLGQQNPVYVDEQLYRIGMAKELVNGQ